MMMALNINGNDAIEENTEIGTLRFTLVNLYYVM